MLWHKAIGAGGFGGAGIEFVGGKISTGLTVSLTSLTGGIASAPSQYDIVLIFSGIGDKGDPGQSVSGYTEIAELFSDGVNDTGFAAYYKVQGATPDTSVTVSSTSTDTEVTGALVFRGVNTATPLDVTRTTATGTGRPTPPNITPVTSGAVVVYSGAGTNNPVGSAFTDTNSGDDWFSQYDPVGTAGQDVAVGFGYKYWAGGTASFSQFGGPSIETNCAITLALRPA